MSGTARTNEPEVFFSICHPLEGWTLLDDALDEYGEDLSASITLGVDPVATNNVQPEQPPKPSRQMFQVLESTDNHPSSVPELADSLTNNQNRKEINILLLGETGVGKSTWINAIANYLTYDTLEEAINNDIQVLIPAQFTMTNENYEEVVVQVGSADKNEVQKDGQSATQYPISHRFETKEFILRVIDTPGIGDTRGIEQDKENFQKIMDHISHLDVIHGICILLQPNHSRLSIFFEFCIKELLTQLHRDTVHNIVFCFTNARSTFYRPGDSLTPLKTLLTEKNTIPSLVPLNKSTIYCLDNEAFRFLAAVKSNQSFDDDEQENFSNSWKTSVKETARMIEHFQTRKPHATRNTVTLNATRQVLIKLAQPLAEVTQNIQTNIALLDDKVNEFKNLDSKEKDLRGKLTIPQVDLEAVDLDHARTVCTDPSCTQSISVYKTSENLEILKTEYVQVCHDLCRVRGYIANQLNSAPLRYCRAMRNGICRHCCHGYEKHMHITYKTNRVMVDVIDQNVQSALQTTEERKKAAKSVITQCEERKGKYEYEQRIITKTGAKFAVFLKENSITPYNNAIIRYLDYMIELEEAKINIGGMTTALDKLKKSRQVYEEEEKLIQEALGESEESNISLDDIKASLETLYMLPLTGPTIHSLLDKATEGAAKFSYMENPCVLKKKDRKGAPTGLFGKFTTMVYTAKSKIRF